VWTVFTWLKLTKNVVITCKVPTKQQVPVKLKQGENSNVSRNNDSRRKISLYPGVRIKIVQGALCSTEQAKSLSSVLINSTQMCSY
jgi:hypothetical protein